MWPTGWTTTENSGPRASIGWTSIYGECRKRRSTMAASNAKASSEGNAAERELVFRRLLDAPRELVFDVWTNPAHVPQWWGPNGFTTTIHEMDVRPGGVWRLTMHGPDGT